MKKCKRSIAAAYFLTALLTLTSCGERSTCTFNFNKHFHRYIDPKSGIELYLDSEQLKVGKYEWQPDYIEINGIDDKTIGEYASHKLFYAYNKNNWNYLYNKMRDENTDELYFYYHHETIKTYTETDKDGNTVTRQKREVDDGWTKDPHHSYNTGECRIDHKVYFAYIMEETIIEEEKNGQIIQNRAYKLKKSGEYDDIREILPKYPYVLKECSKTVCKYFRLNPWELYNAKEENYQYFFEHPDLSNKTPYYKPKATNNTNSTITNDNSSIPKDQTIEPQGNDEDYTFIITF